MSYVIMKSTRTYVGGRGYEGPSCQRADVEQAKVYTYFCEATKAAQKLQEVNPVGWVIHNYIPIKEYETNL